MGVKIKQFLGPSKLLAVETKWKNLSKRLNPPVKKPKGRPSYRVPKPLDLKNTNPIHI